MTSKVMSYSTAKFFLSLILSFVFFGLTAQNNMKDWYYGNYNSSDYNAINIDALYTSILSNAVPADSAVVAVIDSGIDVDHEDLKGIIWTNKDEIPGNNIDDDGNGYIDDVHGWNFIGGPNGDVAGDNLEITRIVREMSKKYENANLSQLSTKEKAEYQNYTKMRDEVEQERAKAESQVANYTAQKDVYSKVLDLVESLLGPNTPINKETIDTISADSEGAMEAQKLLENLVSNGYTFENPEELRKLILSDLDNGINYFKSKVDWHYNLDADPRNIVGDNYADYSQKVYGNNHYEGPDAEHGTHVAGIIGARRDNDLGGNGISNTVKIMSVRCVPDGDERDKDVANAIRYAVDNGAKVINMSFGKGYSPGKSHVDDAVKYAMKHDVLLVHAAGNDGSDVDMVSNFPNDNIKKKFLKCNKVDNWISVGALAPPKGEDMVASFSNYGNENVDVFSPGVQIYSTIPDNHYEMLQGTSMAAPVVAGVAGMLRSYFPDLKAKDIKEIILSSSKKINASVKIPDGDGRTVPFSSLSTSGGILDAEAAFKAAQAKSKIKVKVTGA